MSIRNYWLLWGVFVLAALLVFATGNLTMLTAVVLGSVAFGWTFMGMMNVLPIAVSHSTHPEPEKVEAAGQPMRETPAKAFNVLKSA